MYLGEFFKDGLYEDIIYFYNYNDERAIKDTPNGMNYYIVLKEEVLSKYEGYCNLKYDNVNDWKIVRMNAKEVLHIIIMII